MIYTNPMDNRGKEIHIGDTILVVEDYAFYVKKVVAMAKHGYQVIAADSDGMCGMNYAAGSVVVVSCSADVDLYDLYKPVKVGDEVAYPEYDDAVGVKRALYVDQDVVCLDGGTLNTSLSPVIPLTDIVTK